jgi:hypothetical protein
MATPLTELQLFGATDYLLDEATFAPTGCRGADKVAQRFVYALMTPIGSVPGLPQSGSSFLFLLRNFRSEFDIFAAFSGAAGPAASSVRASETAAEPTSEKFGSAVLLGVSIQVDTITLHLGVLAADGSKPTVPVNVTLNT